MPCAQETARTTSRRNQGCRFQHGNANVYARIGV